jgi:hypothetical protein
MDGLDDLDVATDVATTRHGHTIGLHARDAVPRSGPGWHGPRASPLVSHETTPGWAGGARSRSRSEAEAIVPRRTLAPRPKQASTPYALRRSLTVGSDRASGSSGRRRCLALGSSRAPSGDPVGWPARHRAVPRGPPAGVAKSAGCPRARSTAQHRSCNLSPPRSPRRLHVARSQRPAVLGAMTGGLRVRARRAMRRARG